MGRRLLSPHMPSAAASASTGTAAHSHSRLSSFFKIMYPPTPASTTNAPSSASGQIMPAPFLMPIDSATLVLG